MLTYDVVSTTAYAEKTAHERRYCTQRQPVIANPPPLDKHNHGRFRLQPPLFARRSAVISGLAYCALTSERVRSNTHCPEFWRLTWIENYRQS